MKQIHHSLGDWTYQAGNEYFVDFTQYVSPPSALCCPLADDFFLPHYVFLNEAVSGAINDGMFVTHSRELVLSHAFRLWFRQTNDLSSCEDGANGDGYFVKWDTFNDRIRIYRAGVHQHDFDDVPNAALGAWHSFRVKWYSYINLNLDRIVRITAEVMVNGSWHDCGYWEDSNPLHEGDPVNRVGFAMGGTESKLRSWVDDTEIWWKSE